MLAGLVSLSIGMALVRAVRAATPPGRLRRSRMRMAAQCAVALLVILVCQELAEGHVALLLGHGGWVALPLAAAFAWGLTFLIGPVQRAVAWIARRLRGSVLRRRPTAGVVASWSSGRACGMILGGLGRPGAGRGPPMVTS